MYSSIVPLFLVLWTPSFISCQSIILPTSNTGRIVIDKTNLNLFTLSKNVGTTGGTVPFTISATTAFESSVTVSCVTDPATVDGYTKVTFVSPAPLTSANPPVPLTGTVRFNIVSEGRPVLVTCFGTSTAVNASVVPQFSQSINDTVYIQITAPATVSFCDNVTVPNDKLKTEATFQLKFSEVVKDNNVTVTCQTTTPAAAGNLVITVTNGLGIVGQQYVSMTYKWTGPGNPVTVQCAGVSENNGKQFLATNSAGASAIFIYDQGVLLLYPTNQLVTSQQFKTFLILDTKLTSEVTFVCSLEQFNDTTSLLDAVKNPKCVAPTVNRATSSPISTTPGTPTTTPTTPTTATSQWSLKKTEFTLPESSTSEVVEAVRSSWPTSQTKELLLVTCCVPSDSPSSKYVNKTSVSIVQTSLYPNYPINWTFASAASSSLKETEIKNPAFVEISPCPCDLIVGVCDLRCCCDKDCTAEDKEIMTCYPGIWGGFGSDGPRDESCSSTHYYKEDYWMYVCIERENNAYLGLYYNAQSAKRNEQSYRDFMENKRPQYSWEERDKRSVQETASGYKHGISVQTKVPGNSLTAGKAGVLTLPQKILNGKCLRNAPVRYLHDSHSSCTYEVTKASCLATGSPFSARSYIEASTVTQPPCPNSPQVLSQYGGSAYTKVQTNYFCATDLAGYVKNLQDTDTAVKPSLFSTVVTNASTCYFNDNGLLICPDTTQASTPVTAALKRCTFDNSLNLPPAPSFDDATKTCQNVVLDVKYKFFWAGKTIVNLTADFILGNVPVPMTYSKKVQTYYTDYVIVNITVNGTDVNVTQPVQRVSEVTQSLTYPAELTQKYSTEFRHDYNFTLVNQERGGTLTEAPPGTFSQRSGMPGYEYNKPVIAGVGVLDNTTNKTDSVDYSSGKGLYYFKTGSDNLCSTATKTPVTFKEEVMSTCAVYLTISDFNDCPTLQTTLLSELDKLMPADYLSQLGFVNETNSPIDKHWVKLFRQNLTNDIIQVKDEAAENETLAWRIMVTGYPNGTHDIMNPPDKVKGICHKLPTGIHLRVMSAYVGNINGNEIHRIVGGEITYTVSTWFVKCSGPIGTTCQNASTDPQLFMVTATVDFVDVATDLSSQTRHQVYGGSKCWEEKCEAQVLYPFTKYYIHEPREYTLGWLFVLLVFLLSTFLVTKPWW